MRDIDSVDISNNIENDGMNSIAFMNGYINMRKGSQVSMSSASSVFSDSSDEMSSPSRRASQEENIKQDIKKLTLRRCRSMSDGSRKKLLSDDTFEIFPSLPESVLDKMGLRGNNPRERLTDEEQEQKFTSLSLAFTIDSTTVKDRFERQKRQRDQTENNLMAEIERLTQKINKMKYLCIDFETTELLTALLTQVDIVIKASYLASISAERYGAVQYEDKLSESVTVMVSHVNTLKQQRDSARRQLQYTKRVIQDTNFDTENNNTPKVPRKITVNNKNVVTRRASIASISQSPDTVKNIENKKMTRRKSDLSICSTVAPTRTSRPSRLDLSVDLVKISEGIIETEHNLEDDLRLEHSEALCSQEEASPTPEDNKEFLLNDPGIANLTLRQKLLYKIQTVGYNIDRKYTKWINSGSTESFYFCALVCFSFSLIMMVNILIELELSKWYNT